MSNKLCKYFKICTCYCSGEADEVGEIDELCNIGSLYHKLEKIKNICEEAPTIDSELSLKILEVIGAENV